MTPRVEIRSLAAARDDLPRYRGLLSVAEHAESARFLRQADRDRFALARGLLRELASHTLDASPDELRIERDSLGKPRLVDAASLACNVSHSGDLVAVALGPARQIGVDVEAHRPDIDLEAIGAAFMTPAERAAMRRAAPSQRGDFFFRQWSFKEALVKALGTGLTREPKRFEILFEGGAPQLQFVGPGEDDIGGGWRMTPLEARPDYAGAVVWR
jgi:4'-phosphopantetheinyl transferase